MKSSEDDPEYYLHRDFDRNYFFSGCLFVGKGCDAESDIFIIYGHNMNNGSMFAELMNYLYDDYAAAHRTIYFDVQGERRVYRVFSAFQSESYPDDSDVFKYYEAVGNYSQDEYRAIVDTFCSMSQIDVDSTPQYPAQVMLLSTCSGHTDEGRFVVAAYRIR